MTPLHERPGHVCQVAKAPADSAKGKTKNQTHIAAWVGMTIAEYVESHPDATLMDVRNALADAAEARKQAAVAAALRQAADYPTTLFPEAASEAILALIPDAGSALDRMLDEAQREEREANALIADRLSQDFDYVKVEPGQGILNAKAGSPWDRGREACGKEIAAAIRARGEGDG